jgi:outer membrane protein TolC
MMTVERLNEIQARIEKAKADKARAEGMLDGTLKALKAEFNVSSVAEAENLLDAIQADILADTQKLDAAEKELEQLINWDDPE